MTRLLLPMLALALVAVLLLAACIDEAVVTPEPVDETEPAVTSTPAATPEPVYEYLNHEIPPCTPAEGALIGPCEQGVEHIEVGSASFISGIDAPLSVRDFLDGFGTSVASTHIVVRATYLPNTVRCEPTSVNRSPPWTGFPDRRYEGLDSIMCFADVRANAYLVGSGPSTIPILVAVVPYWGEDIPDADVANRVREAERLLRLGGDLYPISAPEGGIEGREAVLFLLPALNHAHEVWQSLRPWYVQRNDDDSVVVAHPNSASWLWRESQYGTPWRAQVEIPLETFVASVQAAHTARLAEHGGKVNPGGEAGLEAAPMLVTDANMLHSYHVAVENTTHEDGPPVAPPPACGLAVPDHVNNPGLVSDCETLLGLKDALQGTATLNWGVDVVIANWDGIAIGGTPSRVTSLGLDNEGLTGNIPARLGSLTELRHLDLSGNSLTGAIPADLRLLPGLEELRLSGNSLTGCIPPALRDIPIHDLDDLGLPACVG